MHVKKLAHALKLCTLNDFSVRNVRMSLKIEKI